MRFDEYIKTADQLVEFVKTLNEYSHFQKYYLYTYVFEIDSRLNDDIETLAKNPRGKDVFYIRRGLKITNEMSICLTIKVNKKLPLESPNIKTGLNEQFYFHIDPHDTSGISHSQS